MALLVAVKKLTHEARSLTWHHLVVFIITFALYAVYHACRKAFTNIKDLLVKSRSPINSTMYPYDIWQKEHMFENTKEASVFLGELDFLFLIGYGMALFVSGMIGDRINLRYVLTVGIVGSAISTYLSCSLSADLEIENKMYFRSLFFINGLFQSTGWPCLVSVMGNWFSKSSSGVVLGIWGINAYIGNVLGSLIVTGVIDYGYQYGILLNSILALCMGVVVFSCLVPHPNDIGLPRPDDERTHWMERTTSQVSLCTRSSHKGSMVETLSLKSDTKARSYTYDESTPLFTETNNDVKPIKFYEACLIPGVLPYALAFACFKMVTYAFFFWLPTYLSQGLHWTNTISNNISNFYDLGLILGSIISGAISDFVGYRSPVVSSMLVLSLGSVYLYKAFGTTYVTNVILMTLSGCMLGGPANLITSVICADLGKHEKLGKNTQAMATVSGIVNGSGSLGAAVGQLAVGIICKSGGWVWVFHFLLIMITASFILILPMLIQDLKAWVHGSVTVIVQCDE